MLTFRARNFQCLDKCIGELQWNRAIGEIVVTFDLRMAPIPDFVIKNPNRQLSIRKRYVENYFLSSNDQVFLRGARIIAVRLSLVLKFDASLDITARRRLALLLMMIIRRHDQLLLGNPTRLPVLSSRGMSLDSFAECDIGYYYIHTKSDLKRLFELLSFKRRHIFPQRSVMSGEEVFLRGYFELRNGFDQYNIAGIFGGHQSMQSLAFSSFIDHMYFTWSHLILDNVDWWFKSGWMHRSRKPS